jgi:Domain of unknown function (DUF4337)
MAQSKSQRQDRFENFIAITTAILSVLLAIANSFSDSSSKEVILYNAQAQNQWGWYQAKSTRENLFEVAREIVGEESKNPQVTSKIQKSKFFTAEIERYKKEKKEIIVEAKAFEEMAKIASAQSSAYTGAFMFYQIAVTMTAIALIGRDRRLWFGSITLGAIGTFFMIRGMVLPSIMAPKLPKVSNAIPFTPTLMSKSSGIKRFI